MLLIGTTVVYPPPPLRTSDARAGIIFEPRTECASIRSVRVQCIRGEYLRKIGCKGSEGWGRSLGFRIWRHHTAPLNRGHLKMKEANKNVSSSSVFEWRKHEAMWVYASVRISEYGASDFTRGWGYDTSVPLLYRMTVMYKHR